MKPTAVIILIVLIGTLLILGSAYAARKGHLTSKASKILIVAVVLIAGAIVMLYPYLGLQTPSPSL